MCKQNNTIQLDLNVHIATRHSFLSYFSRWITQNPGYIAAEEIRRAFVANHENLSYDRYNIQEDPANLNKIKLA